MTKAEQPTITQALKPCPFCGGEPALDAAEVDEPSFSPEDQLAISWIVGCSCSAFLGPFLDDAEAIAAWNTRASLAAQDGLVEALERCAQIVEQWNHRQNEKVDDIKYIVRNALSAIKGDKS